MKTELWNAILAFDFDKPMSSYGFSTRLARENSWTVDFTQKVILEYKKFMYLAATSDFMVSPSEMVDIVWHQHLIFTESYQKFCAILGKKIKHIPSTHNKEEYQKFWEAKARTKSLYLTNFGEQPASIWEYTNMYASLGLEKAKLSISNIVFIGFILFLILTIPSYFVLKPIFIHVDNPYFLVEFISIRALFF